MPILGCFPRDLDEQRAKLSRAAAQPHGRDPAMTSLSARRPMNLLNHIEDLGRLIASSDSLIEAMEAGRITGMCYGVGPSDPRSISQEIRRLRRKNEEHRSLVRLEGDSASKRGLRVAPQPVVTQR